MKNPLSIFNKETSVVKAISKDTNVSVHDVERVLISAKQITENSSLMMLNNQREYQEDLLNVLQTQGNRMTSIENHQKEEHNMRALNKIELDQLRKTVDEKARTALGNLNQLDFDELINGSMTLDKYSELQKTKAKNTKEYNKKLRVYKNKIWKIVKYHLSDVYHISPKRNIETFNVYMMDEIRDKIKSLSVYEVRRA
ncbi:hypothetical protein [Staphylococcus sp. HMSC063A07]|uniref:hypothetical protein n=1 Tax=Staphylococcus sp. HMSC063A07 TaxID=1715076 RepID=UPI0008A9502E|nr:hypothetical protein [Staphylococcus sp. HMSC063A07]OHP78949.1 hypothetical protein HMPREF2597_04115 [Staphylococcus sp. HMSC063A07]